MNLTMIGIIRTAFLEPAGTPIQSAHAKDAPGTAEILPEFAEGLADLEVFDIKPYAPAFDAFPESRAGWLDANRDNRTRADSRFAPPRP